MNKIFIIILTFNVKKDLLDCLMSVRKLSSKDIELQTVIVDNHSTDGTVEAVKEKFPEFKLIVNNHNLGYTGGNNIGIKYSLKQSADYVLILNPDITVDKNLAKELLTTAENENSGIVGPKIYFAPGSEYHKDRYKQSDTGKVIWWAGGKLDWKNVMTVHRGVDEVDSGQFDSGGPTETVAGTSMFIKREVFEKIGLFDDKYFLYFEESDFCRRAVRAGFKLWYEPKALAWHRNATATGIGSELQDYYTTRNRLLFGFHYAPWRSKLALARQMVTFLVFGRRWVKRGAWDFLLGRFGQGSYQN